MEKRIRAGGSEWGKVGVNKIGEKEERIGWEVRGGMRAFVSVGC